MFTKFDFRKAKQRRIAELLAKGFNQLFLTCDEPDQSLIQENCLSNFPSVRPKLFSAFGYRLQIAHSAPFIVTPTPGRLFTSARNIRLERWPVLPMVGL